MEQIQEEATMQNRIKHPRNDLGDELLNLFEFFQLFFYTFTFWIQNK
jgi:hypothetical protein